MSIHNLVHLCLLFAFVPFYFFFSIANMKLEINGRSVSIISEAVGGTNVDNCPHACTMKPCGVLAQCVPNLESYECQCNPSNLQCNQAEELSVQQNHPTTTAATTFINTLAGNDFSKDKLTTNGETVSCPLISTFAN